MKEWLVAATEYTVVAINAIALVLIAVATVQAFIAGMGAIFAPMTGYRRREVWLRYARWLIAGLTFQLGADILESAIATDWQTIARLAAVAFIRTFLNYFLEKDLREARDLQDAPRETPFEATVATSVKRA
jgi:uncharacterized membrane protein